MLNTLPTLDAHYKAYIKKNQRITGEQSQQDGENIKNSLSNNLSRSLPNPFNNSSLNLLEHLNINPIDIRSITTRAQADNKVPCAKSDIRVTLNMLKSSSIIHHLSVKSTYNKTQLAVHSVNSFSNNLKTKNITIPPNVEQYLNLFTDSSTLTFNNQHFLYNESKRRKRFSADEIDKINPQLVDDTRKFFTTYAQEILLFLISEGNDKKANYATQLAFCKKKLDVRNNVPFSDLLFVDIHNLIQKTITLSQKNGTFFVLNRKKKNSGITTIDLYNGLITLQMKGSGQGASYHNLQFKISGHFINKWINQGLI